MKKILLFFIVILCSISVYAQDVIVMKDGSTIVSKVIEIGSENVKYKKFSNLEGPVYVIDKAEIQVINYGNGEKEVFKEASILINKMDMSDNDLLKLDYALRNNTSLPIDVAKKVKRLRLTGWIGGGVILLGTAAIALTADSSEGLGTLVIPPTVVAVAWTATFLGSAQYVKHKHKNNNNISSTNIINKEIHLSNGNLLMTGIDLLRDRNNCILGVGLRYSF